MSRAAKKSGATPEQQKAIALIRQGRSAFVTGDAGTGKTWTLNEALRGREVDEGLVRLAPTGSAATLIGGSTLHRFFGLPVGLIAPDECGGRVSKHVRERVQKAQTLVIDEISMVRIDVLQAIEEVCRACDPQKRPWGGKQIIATGDFAQLPPVVKDSEEVSLSHLYGEDRRYAFQAKAWQEAGFQTVMLTVPQRQADPAFIRALNALRWRDASLPEALATINARVRRLTKNEAPTILTTTNKGAEEINGSRLETLAGRERVYRARVTGSITDADKPLPDEVRLKVGAAVLMAVNGPTFVNGSRGVVRALHEDAIDVELEAGGLVTVTRGLWPVYSYAVDPKTKKLTQEVVGTFAQMPVRLGFAITVHRSQGVSLETLHIRAGRWFSHGQAYVAISRARSLEGLSLEHPLRDEDVIVDPVVLDFMQSMRGPSPIPAPSLLPSPVPLASVNPPLPKRSAPTSAHAPALPPTPDPKVVHKQAALVAAAPEKTYATFIAPNTEPLRRRLEAVPVLRQGPKGPPSTSLPSIEELQQRLAAVPRLKK